MIILKSILSCALATLIVIPHNYQENNSSYNTFNTTESVDSEEVINSSVVVFIAGILAGYVVDGVLIYTTGYSGGELCAAGLNALTQLTAQNSQITQAYFNSINSNYVDGYTMSNGNECIRTSGST